MAEVNCFGKTEHYNDKITLLNTYDADGDGFIVRDDVLRITQDYYDDKVSQAEVVFVTECFDKYGGDISKLCRRRPPCGDYGDVDGDGWVSTKDLIHTLRYTAGFFDASMTPDQKRRADVNGDGKVTQADALLIAKYIVGQYDTFAVCSGAPPVTPPAYLTPDDALLRIRAGEKCYIKCTLPILNMLPGIPYMSGIPILPGFAITTEP